jgi:hypothetical protein
MLAHEACNLIDPGDPESGHVGASILSRSGAVRHQFNRAVARVSREMEL